MDFELPEELEMLRASVHGWVEANYPKAKALELEGMVGEFPETTRTKRPAHPAVWTGGFSRRC